MVTGFLGVMCAVNSHSNGFTEHRIFPWQLLCNRWNLFTKSFPEQFCYQENSAGRIHWYIMLPISPAAGL